MQIKSGRLVYMAGGLCHSLTTDSHDRQTNSPPDNSMAKNFSVEWLSQSFHSSVTTMDIESAKDAANGFLKPHMPCVVQPRPPSFYKEVSVEPKFRQKTSLQTEKKEETTMYTPASPTNSCGYTSGSESEIGDDSEGETGVHRRMRTKFTSDQIYRLEKTFNKHKYLGATQRRKMAERLHLSETQVKTWFQNRRMKLKREVQDLRAEYFSPALLCPRAFPPPASLQHHGFTGQRVPPHPTAHPLYQSMIPQVPVPQIVPSQLIHPVMLAPHYYTQM